MRCYLESTTFLSTRSNLTKILRSRAFSSSSECMSWLCSSPLLSTRSESSARRPCLLRGRRSVLMTNTPIQIAIESLLEYPSFPSATSFKQHPLFNLAIAAQFRSRKAAIFQGTKLIWLLCGSVGWSLNGELRFGSHTRERFLPLVKHRDGRSTAKNTSRDYEVVGAAGALAR